MNQLFIPEIGTEIELAEDWQFTLYPEHRNSKLGVLLGYARNERAKTSYATWYDGDKEIGTYMAATWDRENEVYVWNKTWEVIFEKGTNLKIDRIYIRKGNKDYSSLSFWVKSGPYKGARFWAKLDDCNKIKFK